MLLAGMPAPVIAAPEEIQVYTDDINAPGEFGLEMHVNYVLEGPRAPVYAGQVPTNHVLQVTPEFSYGFAKNWDAGLYLLSARASDGNLYANGAKLRVKFIAPSNGGLFWGVNMELGRTSKRVTESNMNVEVRPIIGWRNDKWLVSFNPIIGAAVSGDVSREPSFSPALKIARAVEPTCSPSSSAASRDISETTRYGPQASSTCAITLSFLIAITMPSSRLRALVPRPAARERSRRAISPAST